MTDGPWDHLYREWMDGVTVENLVDARADWPEITMADIYADQQFFADHPERRYRSRPAADGRVWLVRRQGKDALLRTLTRNSTRCPDSDAALSRLWGEAARQRRGLLPARQS